jgi:hypothetical protein
MTDLDPRLQTAYQKMVDAQTEYVAAEKLVEENSELLAAKKLWQEADDTYHKLLYATRQEHKVDAKLDAMAAAQTEFYDARDLLLAVKDDKWCNWKRENEKKEIIDCQCGEHINVPLPVLDEGLVAELLEEDRAMEAIEMAEEMAASKAILEPGDGSV